MNVDWEGRFWPKVQVTPDHWIWVAARSKAGYGVIRVQSKVYLAHRLSYEYAYGSIEPGLGIDHQCRERSCVNPRHLRVATQKQNMENLGGARCDSASGVRGVTWDPVNQKWVVSVGHGGATHWGGRHKTLEQAERAAITLRNKLFSHNDVDRLTKQPVSVASNNQEENN